jgi:putative flavoprotein involved in K+ transport
MLSGGHGGHTIALQQLARDGVRLLGRLVDADDGKLRFAQDLADNVRYANQRAAQFRHAVDEYVTRTHTEAPPPDTDPVERPEPGLGDAPEVLDSRTERLGSVIWCTGMGPDTGWLPIPVLGPDRTPAHRRGIGATRGLYVCGYPWLSTRGSGILYGVAADALRIAQHIAGAVRSR